MEPRKNIFSALARQKRKASLEGCFVHAEAVAAFLRELRSQFVGDRDELRPKAFGLKHFLLDETSDFHERIGSGPSRLNRGMGYHLKLFDPAGTDEGSTIIDLGLQEVEVAPDAPGQWGRSGDPQPGNEMFGSDDVTRLFQRVRNSSNKITPVIEPGGVDRDAFELCDTSDALLDKDRTVVQNGDEGYRFYPGLIDIASLGHARHYDRAVAFHNRAFMYMTQSPVLEAGGV